MKRKWILFAALACALGLRCLGPLPGGMLLAWLGLEAVRRCV